MNLAQRIDYETEIVPLAQALLRKLFDIREGEGRRACLMLCYIFLVISAVMIIKPVANSLFLSTFGATYLPIAFLLVAIFAAAVATVYSKLVIKFRLTRLIRQTLNGSITCLLVFWLFLYTNRIEGWILYIFYVWVAIFAVISASQFWILANLVFNAREAKRLFGFIGAGAIAGGIFGGYLTNFLAPAMGSENLLFVAIFLLTLCFPITRKIWSYTAKPDQRYQFRQQQKMAGRDVHPIRLVRQSRHLSYLASTIAVGVVAAKLVEYQFSAVASAEILNEDELTAFFGFWLSNLNVASLLIQLFLTRRVVGVFGVGTSLFFLPVGILIGAVAVLIHPALWTAILLKISDGSLKNSIHKAGIELLAMPIPVEIKNLTKSFIDVFVDSFATGIGGILLVVLTFALNLSVQHVSLLLVTLIIGWLYLAARVRKEYVQSFRLKIERESDDPAQKLPDIRNESVFGGLIKILEGDEEGQILSVLRMVKEIRSPRLVSCFKKLIHHPSGRIRLAVLENIYFYKDDDFSDEVLQLVHDPNQEIKTAAIEYLFRKSTDPISLLRVYLQHEDLRIRTAALLCAARESRKNQEIKNNLGIKEVIEETVKGIPKLANREESEFVQANCAYAIGEANIPELYPYLHIFLNTPSPNIVKAAMLGAARTGEEEFVSATIQHLGKNELRKTARQALASYGAEMISTLASYLENPKVSTGVRAAIPRAIALIGTQRSADILIKNLDQSNLKIRYHVIKALNWLRVNAPHLKINEERVVGRILDEANNYLETLAVLQAQVANQQNAISQEVTLPEARKALIRALEKQLDHHLERIFRLLGLRYPPEDIYNAYQGIQKENTQDMRLNAVEFLDNLLTVDLKKVVVPIAETTVLDALIGETIERFDLEVPSEFECFVKILSGDDDRLKIYVLKLIGQSKEDRYLPHIGRLVESPNQELRDTARWALTEIGILPKEVQ